MTTQDDETLRMYVEESCEHLASIENDLLTIEEIGARINEDLVNKVFRAAHSIKGGAGFLGLGNIRDLSHKIENILGMMRSREIVPDPEIINILLLAFDKLRELINQVDQSDRIDISEHVVALTGLTSVSLPPELKASIHKKIDISLPGGQVLFSVPELDLVRARKEGKLIYLVEYDLIHDVHQRGRTPLDVLKSMQETGIILESKVDITAAGGLEDDALSNRLPFFVLFATIADPDVIGALVEVEDSCIQLIPDGAAVDASPAAEAKPVDVQKRAIHADEGQSAPGMASNGISQRDFIGSSHDSASIGSQSEGNAPETPSLGRSVESPPPSAQAETSLRVHIRLLDSLVTLAGELVLGRNQLLQALSSQNQESLQLACQKINLVTVELQETIMNTRMQPIGTILNKFPRVVRDLARDLDKEVQLTLEGSEVELDKSLIEGLNDPLTHLVRNAVDHGVETPEVRREKGKKPVGALLIRAFHQAGQVNIEITDDGRGIDGGKIAMAALRKGLITEEQARMMSPREKINLIFLPGFSTAEKVTDVSGRGVGMDVVRTNLNRLGGQVDISSEPGKGATIRIKLPLTLAIIPSLLVSTGGERFAIPQVNLDELLRIPASQLKDRMELIGDAEVVRLRENLLPVLNLADVLGMERSYTDLRTGDQRLDRRRRVADRRSKCSRLFDEEAEQGDGGDTEARSLDEHTEGGGSLNARMEESSNSGVSASQQKRRSQHDRRWHAASAVNIAVVSTGTVKCGLVVDQLHDSEDIVVKPLGRHLKQCLGYAGATILGDGRVAMILDVAGLVRMAGLTSVEGADRSADLATELIKSKQDRQAWLVFRSSEDEQFGVPLALVARVEKVKASEIERLGGKKVLQYRGGILPVWTLDEVVRVSPLSDRKNLMVIVFSFAGREVGLLCTGPVDALEVDAKIDHLTLKQPGIMGSTIIGGQATLLVDIFELMETLNPEWLSKPQGSQQSRDRSTTVLLAEDSTFFREQVKKFIEDGGYRVVAAEDGLKAWNLIQENADEISLVVTDIEMPHLDGFGLTRRIREDSRFVHLPIIALTSLASEEDMARGKEAGIDDYQVKLDRDNLMEGIGRLVGMGKNS
jgi:two-component system, chemotaxis family, sensor kinase CheA